MSTGPRTTREALIAELLGDIDTLLARCDAFTAKVDALQVQMASNTATLDAAGERYRQAIITFTEQAKQQVSTYLERKAGEASAKILDSQQAELQNAVLRIVESAAHEAVGNARPVWLRLAELAGVAVLAAALGAGMVYWLMH
jgi:hypothetical protein